MLLSHTATIASGYSASLALICKYAITGSRQKLTVRQPQCTSDNSRATGSRSSYFSAAGRSHPFLPLSQKVTWHCCRCTLRRQWRRALRPITHTTHTHAHTTHRRRCRSRSQTRIYFYPCLFFGVLAASTPVVSRSLLSSQDLGKSPQNAPFSV